MILHFTDAICHYAKESSSEAIKERAFCKQVHRIELESGETIKTKFEADWQKLAVTIKEKFRVVTISDPTDAGDQSNIPLQWRTIPKIEMWTHFGKFVKLDSYTEEKITHASAMCFMALIGNGGKTMQKSITPVATVDIDNCIKEHAKHSMDVIFEALFVLATPKGIPALTTQDSFGKAWRIAISKKNRELYPMKVKTLLDSLSSAGSGLSKEMQDKLKEWIDSSYDMTEEIEDDIKAFWKSGEQGIYIERDYFKNETIRPKDILSVIRGGGEHVPTLMHGILNIKQGVLPETFEKGWIPLSMPAYKVFSLILHLFFPGTKVDSRGSKVLAILALKTACLGEMADELLKTSKSKWISWEKDTTGVQTYECAENFAPMFFRFLTRLDDNHLSEVELKFREKAIRIIKAKSGLEVFLNNIKTALILKKENQYPSYQKTCKICHESRSITLMTKADKCAFCVLQDTISEKKLEKFVDHMVVCRTCRVRYAVLRVKDLNVEPKCAFCRNKDHIKRTKMPMPGMSKSTIMAPRVVCKTCKAPYVCYEQHLPEGMTVDDFTCVVCVKKPGDSVNSFSEKFKDLCNENPNLYEAVGLTKCGFDKFMNKQKLTALLESKEDLFDQNPKNISFVTLNKEQIIDSEEVILQARLAVSGGADSENSKILCSICWEDKLPKFMQKNACGNNNCKNPVCETCVADWYKQAKPGCRVDSSWVTCPFCKTRPKFKVLSATGSLLKKAILPKIFTNDIYGWCLDCNQILVERTHECAQLEPPEFTEFKCGCKEMETELTHLSLLDLNDDVNTAQDFDYWARTWHQNHQISKRDNFDFKNVGATGDSFEKALRVATRFGLFDKGYKLCPGCGNGVKKTSGCDHMTCFCGCHWCWACGMGHTDSHGDLCVRGQSGATVCTDYESIYDHWSQMDGCSGKYVYQNLTESMFIESNKL